MSRRRRWTVLCALVVLLAFPREGRAGFWDVIIEMSGPKMYGFSGDCRLNLDGTWDSCKVGGAGGLRGIASAFVEQRTSKVWLSLAGGYYFSADATVNGQDYERNEVKMLTFDPMLEFESHSWPRRCRDQPAVRCDRLQLQIYHGIVGISYNLLFGADFPTFSNVGLKLRPFGIVVPITDRVGADFSYDLRLYPRGFTAEDFGRFTIEPEGAGAEAVHAFVLGIRIKRKG